MPDLRKDPIVGRWVIIAKNRAKRPHDLMDGAVLENDQDPLVSALLDLVRETWPAAGDHDGAVHRGAAAEETA